MKSERGLSNEDFLEEAWESHSAQESPIPLPALWSQVFSKAVARKVSMGPEDLAGRNGSLEMGVAAESRQTWQEDEKSLSGPEGSGPLLLPLDPAPFPREHRGLPSSPGCPGPLLPCLSI